MARFEPSGDPAAALKAGLYVEVPGQSIAARMQAYLELRPKSSHLLAGPSGAGKTMQLRVLERSLSESEELSPIFIDATAEGKDFHSAGKLLEHLANVIKALQVKEQSGMQLSELFLFLLEAKLVTRTSPTDPIQETARLKRKPVLLLDSLDRLPIDIFTKLCSEDLAKIKQHIAVVVVGSPDVMYGAARPVVDQFDYFQRQPTYDPRQSSEMHVFLAQVIRQRAGEDLIPTASCTPLVEASGGILRDLISLTQLALEESYVAGHHRVEPSDVHRAVDTFGRKHIIGLDSRELALLQRLRKTGDFVRVDDRDVSLLVSRRVLEYADETGAPTFAVHPTLLPLLEKIGDA